jgi:hypothetical protein
VISQKADVFSIIFLMLHTNDEVDSSSKKYSMFAERTSSKEQLLIANGMLLSISSDAHSETLLG